MAYILGGGNNESDGFTTAIANFALRAMHESQGLVDFTQVVTPNQGNEYLVPNFAPITYQDYTPVNGEGGFATGGAVEQNPALGQGSITATPAVAATAFDVFYGWTTAFQLAATIGAELGESYAEKVDQRVCAAFASFKATPGNTNYSPTPQDGFARPLELGAMELVADGDSPAGATGGFTANSVLGLVRNVKQNYKTARLPGTPIIVLDADGDSAEVTASIRSGSSMNRLLDELTGGAVGSADSGGSAITSLGEELLATGQLSNIYGCAVIFSTFLDTDTRTVAGVSGETVLVGAYFHETAIFTVLKEGLQVKMGEKPGGLQMWVTGLAYMGAGVADKRRGGAINILQA